jgi:hypothetical protein
MRLLIIAIINTLNNNPKHDVTLHIVRNFYPRQGNDRRFFSYNPALRYFREKSLFLMFWTLQIPRKRKSIEHLIKSPEIIRISKNIDLNIAFF